MLSWLIAALLNLAISGAAAQRGRARGRARPRRDRAAHRRTVGRRRGRRGGRPLIALRRGRALRHGSTFKLPLAGAILPVERGRSLRTTRSRSARADLLDNSPVVRANARGAGMPVGTPARRRSSRSATTAPPTCCSRRIGGPEALTGFHARLRRSRHPARPLRDGAQLQPPRRSARHDQPGGDGRASPATSSSATCSRPPRRAQLRGWMVGQPRPACAGPAPACPPLAGRRQDRQPAPTARSTTSPSLSARRASPIALAVYLRPADRRRRPTAERGDRRRSAVHVAARAS